MQDTHNNAERLSPSACYARDTEDSEEGVIWVTLESHRRDCELLQMQIDTLTDFKAAPLSSVSQSIVDQVSHRDAMGRRKYRQSLDRKDLSLADWAEHAKQEALDQACYLERVRRGAALIEDARELCLRIAANENTIDREAARKASVDWLRRYDAQFDTHNVERSNPNEKL